MHVVIMIIFVVFIGQYLEVNLRQKKKKYFVKNVKYIKWKKTKKYTLGTVILYISIHKFYYSSDSIETDWNKLLHITYVEWGNGMNSKNKNNAN